jgi:hypothetical protein
MLRASSFRWVIIAVGVFSGSMLFMQLMGSSSLLSMSRQHLDWAIEERMLERTTKDANLVKEHSRDAQRHSDLTGLYSSIAGTSTAVAGPFLAVLILCGALSHVIGKLTTRLHESENKINTLVAELRELKQHSMEIRQTSETDTGIAS